MKSFCHRQGPNQLGELSGSLKSSKRPDYRDLQKSSSEKQTTRIVNDGLSQEGKELDLATRMSMGARFRSDFSKVRIHTDERAATAASALFARAFTVNHDIVFGAGEYQPRTHSGRQLLSHELAHVVQRGRENVTLPSAGASIKLGSPNDPAEVEASRAADDMAQDRQGVVEKSSVPDLSVMREPVASPKSPIPKGGDPVRLRRLFDATKATPIGKEFTSSGVPAIVWGSCKFYGEFDIESKTITLNTADEKNLTDNEWMQVIAMELGNFANLVPVATIFTIAEEGDVSKEEFVLKIEDIEWRSREKVITARENGEFGPLDATRELKVFPGGHVSFDDYWKKVEDHRAELEEKWDETCAKIYFKKHTAGSKSGAK